MTVPGARLTVPAQIGFATVYPEADSAIAFATFQLPNSATLPTILIVCPTTVVALSVNVTATLAGVVQLLDAVVVADTPPVVVDSPLVQVHQLQNINGAVE